MNKSVRVLLFFAVFLLAACGKISVFVTPTGVTDCTIDVSYFTDYAAGLEHNYEPTVGGFSSEKFGNVFLTEEIHDAVDTNGREVEEYTVNGEFDVRAVRYDDGKWYFEVFGNRTARGESNRHSPYFSNVIASAPSAPIFHWFWLSQQYVTSESFAGGVITCANTGEEIDISDVASREGDSLYAVCGRASYVKSVETPLYLAPDEDRPILRYVNPADGQFDVIFQYVDENGVLWYDILIYRGRVSGWIKASAIGSYICEDIFQVEPPPVTIAEESEDSSTATDCDSFALVSPGGPTIPAGNVTFKWTLVADADQYFVWFYDYAGEFAQTFMTTTNSLTINVGALPTGSELTWDVYAQQDGETLCQTPRSATLTKQAAEVQEVVETEEPEEDKKKKSSKPSETEEPDVCDEDHPDYPYCDL